MSQGNLSPAQKAQLDFLGTVPPRFERFHRLIEELATLRDQDGTARKLARMLDEFRNQAAALSLTPLADQAGIMSQLARRGGGIQLKLRGLREGLMGLKINYEGAVRSASRAETDEENGDED